MSRTIVHAAPSPSTAARRPTALGTAAALALLAACGGGGGGSSGAAISTAVGTPVGAPVVQAVGSGGGTISGGGVTVTAPAGAFAGAQVTLQPVTDTLSGAGQGIAISADAAWQKYLRVSFPLDPADADPEATGLAVQQADGTWLALEPVQVDTSAGTVTAGLPPVTSPAAQAAPGRLAAVQAAAAASPRVVVAFKRFYLKPEAATVAVKQALTLVPYARVLERPRDCVLPPADPADELVPLPPSCWIPVARDYPFLNDKAGFVRSWLVNGVDGGGAAVGTIAASGAAGGRYTAPASRPSPDTVTVTFLSYDADTLQSVSPKARVKVTGGVDDWVVTQLQTPPQHHGVSSAVLLPGGYSLTAARNELRFGAGRASGFEIRYEAAGSFTVTSQSAAADSDHCVERMEPATVTVSGAGVQGTLTLTDFSRAGAPDPGLYVATVLASWTATEVREGAGCLNPHRFENVPYAMIVLATGTAGLGALAPDATVLTGTNTDGNGTYGWSMARQ